MNKLLSPPLLFRLAALLVVALVIAGLAISAASAVEHADYSVSWYTFDGGGGTSAGGDYTLMGTIGQPDAGVAFRHRLRPDRRLLGLGGALPGLPAADQTTLASDHKRFLAQPVRRFTPHRCQLC